MHIENEIHLAMLSDARPMIGKAVSAYRGKERHDAAEASAVEKRQSEWQAAADQIWQRNPKLSKPKVGEMLAKGSAHSAGTIRRKIVRPAK